MDGNPKQGRPSRLEQIVSNFFENKSLCSKCGGKCCKSLPGAAYPEDFEMDKGPEKLQAAIQSGKWAIDWWEGDPGDGLEETAYYVRPATKDNIGKIYDASWGGECVFLTPDGCMMEIKGRPRECRELEPKKGKAKCISHNGTSKRDSALAWRKHFGILDAFNC